MIHAGMLLVASPDLADPNFRRSVVQLIEHGDQGTLGLIINRPLPIPLREVWEGVPVGLADASIAADGGPVERGRAILLHGQPELDGAQELAPGIAVGGAIQALARRWETGPDHAGPRLFLGHSGWSPGQLQAELAQGTWLLRPARDAWLLATPPEDLWSRLSAGRGLDPEPGVN